MEDHRKHSWLPIRLKFLKTGPFLYGANESAESDDREQPRFIRITDVRPDGSLREDTFRSLPESVAQPYMLKNGDILLARSGATVGKAFMYKSEWGPCCFAGYLIRFPADKRKVRPDYVRYYTQSKQYVDYIRESTIQATIQNVSAERYGNLQILLPSLNEQDALINFLNRETAKLDQLVEKKQRLIELLHEKRQSLITHAVTKGLDPNVPMKDSGIPWLGEVPAHWDVVRVKHVSKILRGQFSHRPRNDPSLYNGPFPFIQTGDVSGADKYIVDFKQTLNENGFRVSKEFPEDTLVMTIAANVGDVAILRFRACFPDSIVGFVPGNNIHLEYLYYCLKASRQALLQNSTVNTQLNLNIERVGEVSIAIPDEVEQRKITDYLNNACSKIDDAVIKLRRQIDLLKDYRQSLVSAAVTGQLDIGPHAVRVEEVFSS